MLSSTIPCPRCGANSVVTIFGPNGPDLSRAEISFACQVGHDVPVVDVLAAWEVSRGVQTTAG